MLDVFTQPVLRHSVQFLGSISNQLWKKNERTSLSSAPGFLLQHCFWKVPRRRPTALLVSATCRWRRLEWHYHGKPELLRENPVPPSLSEPWCEDKMFEFSAETSLHGIQPSHTALRQPSTDSNHNERTEMYVTDPADLQLSTCDRFSTVVKMLCYKSEGRWFDPRWCHWNFFYWH